MTKDAVFTMKLEPELRDAFMAAAAAQHMPASQILRKYMRSYIETHQKQEAYEAYVQREVALAREDIAAGRLTPGEEVEAEFTTLREEWRTRL